MQTQRDLATTQTHIAMDKYHSRYDNDSYTRATSGKLPQYGNALIDDCLALCGHPHYKLSYRRWSKKALEHLKRFQ